MINMDLKPAEIVEINDLEQIHEANKNGIVNPSRTIRMLNRIVLDITYECTLKCLNCNRLCGVFPRKNEIDMASIINFVDHSIEMEKKWFHIYIAGGEPSLHSRILRIFKEVQRYIEYHKKRFKTNLIIKYFTNNHSPRSRQVLKELPDFIINNSNKKDANTPFKPICVAPLDLGYYDDENLKPCQELYQCGMTLNYKGYYPCAPAAAIDDVFIKKDMAIKTLKEVTFERMAEILHRTCRYCGHYFEPVGYKRNPKLMLSGTWKNYLEKTYRMKKTKRGS
ncbi:MAG: hypothetical protein JXB88_19305 [Spirochaetales bacterium]|nr:hypothetical protein [Spirochaetales bacterium]